MVADPDWLTFDDFAGRVGERFEVYGAEDRVLATELVEATEGSQLGGPGPDGSQRRQFSLVFRGPSTPLLAQGTYRLVHAELGELALFLVPIGPDDAGPRYEAAFA